MRRSFEDDGRAQELSGFPRAQELSGFPDAQELSGLQGALQQLKTSSDKLVVSKLALDRVNKTPAGLQQHSVLSATAIDGSQESMQADGHASALPAAPVSSAEHQQAASVAAHVAILVQAVVAAAAPMYIKIEACSLVGS